MMEQVAEAYGYHLLSSYVTRFSYYKEKEKSKALQLARHIMPQRNDGQDCHVAVLVGMGALKAV